MQVARTSFFSCPGATPSLCPHRISAQAVWQHTTPCNAVSPKVPLLFPARHGLTVSCVSYRHRSQLASASMSHYQNDCNEMENNTFYEHRLPCWQGPLHPHQTLVLSRKRPEQACRPSRCLTPGLKLLWWVPLVISQVWTGNESIWYRGGRMEQGPSLCLIYFRRRTNKMDCQGR